MRLRSGRIRLLFLCISPVARDFGFKSSVVGVGVREGVIESAKDDLEGPRSCREGFEGDVGVLFEWYAASSSCGWRRREGELRYPEFCARTGDSVASGRFGVDMALQEKKESANIQYMFP